MRAHRQALQQDDHGVALAHLDLAQRRDGEGATVLGPDEAVALQAAQRLAHDGRVDLELVGEDRPRPAARRPPSRPQTIRRSISVHVRSRVPCPMGPRLPLRPRDSRRSPPVAARGYVYSIWTDWPVSQKEHSVDLNDTPEQAEYRETGARLARGAQGARRPACAATARRRRGRATSPRAARWQGKLAEGGLAGVTWPNEFGGQGLGPDRAGHRQPGDRARRACPGSSTSSASACSARRSSPTAPTSRRRATSAPMLHGDEVWCQLFSEPAAGSDLAAVQTRARQSDDGSLGAQRPEGVDDQRAVRLLRPAARAHRPRRAQAQGPDDVHRADGRRRASRSAACARSPARPSSTRSSSTTCELAGRRGRAARSTAAGARR